MTHGATSVRDDREARRDGMHVARATGALLGVLALLAAAPAAGRLTFVEMQQEGVGGVAGLDGPRALALSPDGAFLYVASEYGIEGLRNPFAYVSPDGRSVYVIGWNTPLMIFARDPTTGRLTLREIKRDGEQGLDGLADPFYLVFSPDRAQLYVAARGDDAVTLFRIDDDICVGDRDGDGEVTIDELITAVNNALSGCPSASAEQGCLASGGAVTSALCCLATGDFPDTCAIGPCGCAPEASHQVRACACGAERCFDGGSCVRP